MLGRLFSSSSSTSPHHILAEFEFKVKDGHYKNVLHNQSDGARNIYLLGVYQLLDEYRPHVGNMLKMIELQKAIESLSLESFIY